MAIIKNAAFMIPRGTSHLVVAPLYERPLLQLKFNTSGDRASWLKTLDAIPEALPPAAHASERDLEAEMTRLSANYGNDAFRKVYPLDELFEKAFEGCQIAALPGNENSVPDMVKAPTALVEEFVELNVPTLTTKKATKLVDAGYQVLTIGNYDTAAIMAATGMSANLIRTIVEAAKHGTSHAAPPRAPRAPSEMRATIENPILST